MSYSQKITNAFTPDELDQLQKMTFVKGFLSAWVDEDNEVVYCEGFCEAEVALIRQQQTFEVQLMEEGLLPKRAERLKALIKASDKNLEILRAFRKKYPLTIKNGAYSSALAIVQFYPMFNYEEKELDFDLKNPNNYFRSNPEFVYRITKHIETTKVSNLPKGMPDISDELLAITKDNIDLFVQTGRLMLESFVQKH